MKILLAEDDLNIIRIAQTVLEKMGGHQVDTAKDGGEAGFSLSPGLPCSKTQNQSHKVPWCVCPEFQTPLHDHSKNQKSRETDNKVQKLFFNDLGHEAQKGFWNGHRDLLGVWGKVKSHFFHRGA